MPAEARTLRHGGQDYNFIVGSDVIRDGMYVAIHEGAIGDDMVIEIFYSDTHHAMSVTYCKPGLALEIVQWAIDIARKRLPPQTERL